MKKIISFIVFALILAIPTIVLASFYETNITLMPGGIESTASKKFTKGKFSITYDVDAVFDDSYQRYAIFGLFKKNLITTKLVTTRMGKTDYHTRVDISFGNQDAGTYHYEVAAKSNVFDIPGPNETYSGFIGTLYQNS